MNKGISVVLSAAIIFFIFGICCSAKISAAGKPPDTDDILERQMDELEIDATGDFLQEFQSEVGEDLPPMDLQSIVRRMREGEAVLSLNEIVAVLLRVLASEVISHVRLIAQLLVLALLASLLRQVEGAWGQETVSVVARAVIYLGLATVAMVTFRDAFSVAHDTISRLGDMMLALLPMLISLLAASGAFTTAVIFQPVVIFVCQVVAHMIRFLVFPLVFAAVVLHMAGHFTSEGSFDRLADLIRKMALWTLEAAMVVFLGVMTVQGAAGAVSDGVALRSIKFAAKAMIPVLGSVFSDAGEVVMTSSLLLKNAAGVLGLVMVALVAAVPLLRLIAMTLAYRLAAALATPLGGADIGKFLESLADGLVLISVAVGAVAVMFYLTLTIILGAGNATVMLR